MLILVQSLCSVGRLSSGGTGVFGAFFDSARPASEVRPEVGGANEEAEAVEELELELDDDEEEAKEEVEDEEELLLWSRCNFKCRLRLPD